MCVCVCVFAVRLYAVLHAAKALQISNRYGLRERAHACRRYLHTHHKMAEYKHTLNRGLHDYLGAINPFEDPFCHARGPSPSYPGTSSRVPAIYGNFIGLCLSWRTVQSEGNASHVPYSTATLYIIQINVNGQWRASRRRGCGGSPRRNSTIFVAHEHVEQIKPFILCM